MTRAAWLALGPLVAGLIVAGGMVRQRVSSARFVREIPWATRGLWVAADTHVHTKFSDGSNTVAEVVEKAREYGCGALAITDHADRTLTAGTLEYQAAIEAARAANPDLTILAGLEWNVPPWGGDEHAALLVPPGPQEAPTLAGFKRQFDDFELEGRPKPTAEAALAWLAESWKNSPVKPVVFYNHPSRADASSLENVADILKWRKVNDLVVGFEGAPGHQQAKIAGSYGYKERPLDRWDPVAARPGDAWDTLLQRGVDVTAALANSDFHNAIPTDLNDPWPCQFAETWWRVPDKSGSGVLRAMRAGSAFAVHGHIARDVELTVDSAGLPRPATAGEAIAVPPAATLTVKLSLLVPEVDWEGKPNKVDTVEFIVVTQSGVKVSPQPVAGLGRQSVSQVVTVDAGGVVIRARGRRSVPDGPALMFYTNAIRVAASR